MATTASWKAVVTNYVLNESFLFYHFGKDAFLIILETPEIVIQYQVNYVYTKSCNWSCALSCFYTQKGTLVGKGTYTQHP